MHDLKWIRENPDAFEQALLKRSDEFDGIAEKILDLDRQRRAVVQKLQDAQSRRNAASKEIGKAKGAGDDETAQTLIDEVANLKESIRQGEDEQRRLDKELTDLLATIPNLALDDVPAGADETANALVREWGEKRAFDFPVKQHFEIGEALGLMDFETAAKLSGSRFVVLKGALARMERALASFMLDIHTSEFGYEETLPPALVRDDALFGTGQLPKFMTDQFMAVTQTLTSAQREAYATEQARLRNRDEATLNAHDAAAKMFELIKQSISKADIADERRTAIINFLDEFGVEALRTEFELSKRLVENAYLEAIFENSRWLIPTAEVPLTNLVRDEIVDEADLPMRVTAWTPCFRAEAGAAGRDTRGMIRQHQFSKVELVTITTPDQSLEELERMTECAETVLQRLELPYRTVVLSTGDMGFAARKTYDIEVWLPGQDAYREISSCSVCGDFQARRMNARYRSKEDRKDIRYVHTLNGSGLAVGRAMIAILENFQNADGSVTIPPALRPYMGGLEKIAAT